MFQKHTVVEVADPVDDQIQKLRELIELRLETGNHALVRADGANTEAIVLDELQKAADEAGLPRSLVEARLGAQEQRAVANRKRQRMRRLRLRLGLAAASISLVTATAWLKPSSQPNTTSAPTAATYVDTLVVDITITSGSSSSNGLTTVGDISSGDLSLDVIVENSSNLDLPDSYAH